MSHGARLLFLSGTPKSRVCVLTKDSSNAECIKKRANLDPKQSRGGQVRASAASPSRRSHHGRVLFSARTFTPFVHAVMIQDALNISMGTATSLLQALK